MTEYRAHIPISKLWEYAREWSPFETAHWHHLKSCEDCVAILWLSRTADSVEHLECMLRDLEVSRFDRHE
jgi:hypothetical protein